jgi:hypothetical protein
MKSAAIILAVIAASASAQGVAPYSELRFRGSLVKNTSFGAISDNWSAKTGFTVDVGTPLTAGEVALGLSHIGYTSTTGQPDYKATVFSLSWLSPEYGHRIVKVSGGIRLSDYRMDFDDPNAGPGLKTEEEVMPGVIGRGRLALTPRFSLVADGAYGLLMVAHHTPMTFLSVGGQATVAAPGWLRDFLR